MKKLVIPLCLTMIALLTGCSTIKHLVAGNQEQIVLTGDIYNNLISASSTVSGKIVEMNKRLGEPVKKGDVIAVIDHAGQDYVIDQLRAVVDMKTAKLEELKAGSRPEQIEQAEAQVRAAKAQLELLKSGSRQESVEQARLSVAAAEEALALTQLTYDHAQREYFKTLNLYEAGAATKEAVDEMQYSLNMAEKQLSVSRLQWESAKQQLALLEKGATPQEISAAEAHYDAAVAQLNLLKSGATRQAIEAAEADLQQAVAQLNQAKHNVENSYIRALADGIIISLNYELGDVVNVGGNIADIAVADDVYVLVYLPSKHLDKIAYNQPLKVVTPLGEQTGRVSYIALTREYTPKDKQSASDGDPVTTKIKVAIDDMDGRLKSGMTAEVVVPLK